MAEAVIEDDEVADVDTIVDDGAADGKAKKRVKLAPENVYFFSPDQEKDSKVAKVKKEDGTEAPMFRRYTVCKNVTEYEKDEKGQLTDRPAEGKFDLLGFSLSRGIDEALGEYAKAKGLVAFVTEPGQRGASGPRIDQTFLKALQIMWDTEIPSQRSFVKEACADKPQYSTYFDLSKA